MSSSLEDRANAALRASLTDKPNAWTNTLTSYIFGATSATVAAADLYATLKTSADNKELSINILDHLQSHYFLTDKLAELVVALVALEEGGVGTEGGISSSFGCSFEQELGDRTHSTWGRLREEAAGEDAAELMQDHISLHRLIAMVVAKGGGGGGDRAGRLQQDSHSARFGIAVTGLEDALFIICALEEEYPADLGEKERAVDDVDIATAALYFLFAPRVLAQASANQIGKTSGGPLWKIRGSLWTGELGYSSERWTLWKERLTTIKSEDVWRAETRELASKALRGVEIQKL